MSRIEEALKKAESRKKTATLERPAPAVEPKPSPVEKAVASAAHHDFSHLLSEAPMQVEHLMLATARDDDNVVVEEYNKLRSTVIALTKGEQFLNTILVTSTVAEEGKSMTALNLAISLAKEQDHTVLLVDADLRRPSVHKFLGVDAKVGLAQCLRDKLPVEKALIKTGIGKLVVLPAGDAIKDPVDLLSSKRLKEIAQELKERYPDRYIVFDSPPALPFADAGILASVTDSTLFVVREGSADLSDIEKTVQEFKEHNLLGIVYNDSHSIRKKSNYYYY